MSIKRNADELMRQSGIIGILQKYGYVSVVGSYNMGIMTWNDLDIYFDNDNFSHNDYCSMMAELVKVLIPVRLDGIFDLAHNQVFLEFQTEITGEHWNVDIWRKTKVEIEESIDYMQSLVLQMEKNPKLKDAVLRIKNDLIKQKLYGPNKGKEHYHSKEIYDAVFIENILSAEQLLLIHPKSVK